MNVAHVMNGNYANNLVVDQIINLTNITSVDDKVNYLLNNVILTGNEINIKVILVGTLANSGIKDIIKTLNFNTDINTGYHFRWTKSTHLQTVNHVESLIIVSPLELFLQTKVTFLSRQLYNKLLEVETNVERVQLGYKPLFFSMKDRLVKDNKNFNLSDVIYSLLTLIPTSWNLSYEVLNDNVEYVSLVLHVDKRQ